MRLPLWRASWHDLPSFFFFSIFVSFPFLSLISLFFFSLFSCFFFSLPCFFLVLLFSFFFRSRAAPVASMSQQCRRPRIRALRAGLVESSRYSEIRRPAALRMGYMVAQSRPRYPWSRQCSPREPHVEPRLFSLRGPVCRLAPGRRSREDTLRDTCQTSTSSRASRSKTCPGPRKWARLRAFHFKAFRFLESRPPAVRQLGGAPQRAREPAAGVSGRCRASLGQHGWCLTRKTLERIAPTRREASWNATSAGCGIPDESYSRTLVRLQRREVESR